MNARTIGTLVFVMLSMPPLVAATILKAGPDGDHTSIRDAINAAMVPGEENEIRVQAATYQETLDFPSSMTAGAVHLTGGWNSSFTVRDSDPRTTVLDGST